MKLRIVIYILLGVVFAALVTVGIWFLVKPKAIETQPEDQTEDQSEDESEVSGAKKLIFIHHSTGENWLMDDNGGLGEALMGASYFVSDTNYGWGPDSIGDLTDIGHWSNWFRGEDSQPYLEALYEESGQNSEYSRLTTVPAGENEIIMFKSCFPNSNLGGDSDDPIPSIDNNPLVGQDSGSQYHTIANAKGIYVDLLNYFETEPDKLFVVVTAPPLGRNNTTSTNAANARALNNWIKSDWLDNYPYENVVVFDLYDILTNNGASNYSLYSTGFSDDHPYQEGNQLATYEFIPFLDSAYADWKGD